MECCQEGVTVNVLSMREMDSSSRIPILYPFYLHLYHREAKALQEMALDARYASYSELALACMRDEPVGMVQVIVSHNETEELPIQASEVLTVATIQGHPCQKVGRRFRVYGSAPAEIAHLVVLSDRVRGPSFGRVLLALLDAARRIVEQQDTEFAFATCVPERESLYGKKCRFERVATIAYPAGEYLALAKHASIPENFGVLKPSRQGTS